MPKRVRISLDQIADWRNLQEAAYLAGNGKRSRPAVERFFRQLDRNLSSLGKGILEGTISPGAYREFEIYDPKRRIIHAPSFRDRVFHHAIMLQAGKWIDRSLIDDSFACRKGKGSIAAVHRAQHFSRRFPWYVKVDVHQYFPSVAHSILMSRLARRFKGRGFLSLLGRVVGSFASGPGHGLPIGALTSQYFANLYLDKADRWLLALPSVRGLVRYMDDTVCWLETKKEATTIIRELNSFLRSNLKLTISSKTQINRVDHGLSFCGHRIFPGTIKLTRRRQRLYVRACRRWEATFVRGQISTNELQGGYAGAFAIAKHAESATWRRRRLKHHLIDDV